MIRITIEMVPGGVGTPRPMHVIEIWNDVKGTLASGGTHGDYEYRISRLMKTGRKLSWVRTGHVAGFNRKNRNSVQLLLDVLNDAYRKQEADV